ncbi:MAG: recombinase family protein [Albidovulum sp.]|nr:recombinase family protein [Albidovulum sp.]
MLAALKDEPAHGRPMTGLPDALKEVDLRIGFTGSFPTFAGLSELERNLVKDRTEEGRQSARKRGVKFGRKPKLTTHQQSEAARMLSEGQSIRSVARHFNVGVATIDRMKNAQSTPT